MNDPLISGRLSALHDAVDALTERFVVDAPVKRFAEKSKLMEGQSLIIIKYYADDADTRTEASKKRAKL
jgi:hypothetical protein